MKLLLLFQIDNCKFLKFQGRQNNFPVFISILCISTSSNKAFDFFSSVSDKNAVTDTAGAIRAAGGGFARMEIAHEEEYFYKQVRNASSQY